MKHNIFQNKLLHKIHLPPVSKYGTHLAFVWNSPRALRLTHSHLRGLRGRFWRPQRQQVLPSHHPHYMCCTRKKFTNQERQWLGAGLREGLVGWARRSELEGGHRFLVNGILQSSYLGTFSQMLSCDCCDSALVLSGAPDHQKLHDGKNPFLTSLCRLIPGFPYPHPRAGCASLSVVG